MNTINYTQVRKAVLLALKEFDKEFILEIAEELHFGWGNGCDILNDVDYDTLKRVFSIIETNEGVIQ